MGIDSHLRSSVVLGKRPFVENEILKEAIYKWKDKKMTVKGSEASHIQPNLCITLILFVKKWYSLQ